MSEYKLDLNNYTNEPPKPITHEMFNKLIKQRDQYKAERDTLIDDIAVLKANISRLERENGELRNKLEGAETYIDAIEPYFHMYEEASKRYNTLTNHIRLKAENNPGVSRYIDLVNYIDRLEKGDN